MKKYLYLKHEIKLKNKKLQSCVVKKAISPNNNGKAKVMFITNSFIGGTVLIFILLMM